MKLHEDMAVESGIVGQLFEEDFTTADDADIQLDLEKKLESLGRYRGALKQTRGDLEELGAL
ncbi:MAG: hypothetical protein OXI39_09590 [Gemmatimonadota bacterium]|uniref:hypothetical protein n=1 Tax=Candidatus Palauibacter scopulicola TaxID=3056741 RepID=UPI0023994112|nr:hypothetical protein [Candidatus Palauibacter scopulicola]MDE2663237.1 hypothetical protein [Candidatus Palauibacter scopulicola]